MQRKFEGNGTTTTNLQGAINLVNAWAEMAFYSRAAAQSNNNNSTRDNTFLPNMTWDQVYSLLAWHYWSRSILDLNTVQALVKGSQMAHVFLDSLHSSSPKDDDRPAARSFPDVTIGVGHDGDINSLSSVLEMSWDLNPPFQSKPFWNPAPPGSALHVTASRENGRVLSMEFLYPDISSSDGSTLVLKTVPVQFTKNDGNKDTPEAARSVNDLRKRIHDRLRTVPGALECFDKTNTTRSKVQATTALGEMHSFSSLHWMAFVSGILLCYRRRLLR
jgi:hypothetical protein